MSYLHIQLPTQPLRVALVSSEPFWYLAAVSSPLTAANPLLARALMVITLASTPCLAAAQPRAARETAAPAKVLTVRDVPAIATRLSGTSADDVRAAVDELAIIDKPEIVTPLATALRAGQPDPICDRMLEVLGGLARPEAIEVLTEFTHHRRLGARLRAYRGLAAIEDPRIATLLLEGLRDSDRSIRATTALALGDIGARAMLDYLFVALDRGVVEAAISIGKLGDVPSIARYAELLGRQPLGVMLTGFDQYLRRTDLNEAAKKDIVARLGEVAGPMVKRFLQDYARTFSPRDKSALKKLLEETIRRIPDGARGTRIAPAAEGAAPVSPEGSAL